MKKSCFPSVPLLLLWHKVTIVTSFGWTRPPLAQGDNSNIIRVKYGYFPEARPYHAACARGWLDLYHQGTIYHVTCYPQTSGNYAASRLDNEELQIAHLGSTPLAQAIARGVDVKVIYIGQYKGDSQGIFVRVSEPDYIGIVTPFDLKGRTVAVPFGSTMHFQILYLLHVLGLQGSVTVLDMSPTEIIAAWDRKEIDAAGCWGATKSYILKQAGNGNPAMQPANVLMSASVIADWGRPTYNVLAANRKFTEQHADFVRHFVGVIARLNDSYLDRLGENDVTNVQRWNARLEPSISYVPSMVDALMLAGEEAGNPSKPSINNNRNLLDEFIQLGWEEQVSCKYLGPGNLGGETPVCDSPTDQHITLRQTAEFLRNQKMITETGPIIENMGEETRCQDFDSLCGSDTFDGSLLTSSFRQCASCYPVGIYAQSGSFAGKNNLLEEFDRLDDTPFAEYEIGRVPQNSEDFHGDSTCDGISVLDVLTSPQTGVIGDGAHAFPLKSYSDNLNCTWVIWASDSKCQDIISLTFERFRVWSGDFIRVYTDPHCQVNRASNILLGQFSGDFTSDDKIQQLPSISSKCCLMVNFITDGNIERVYAADSSDYGDGFLAAYDRKAKGCSDASDCSGFHCGDNGLCDCGALNWGADCSFSQHCLGTNRVLLENRRYAEVLASSADFVIKFSPDSVRYPNDLDCTWEIQAPDATQRSILRVVIEYDLEATFDLLWLQSGSGANAKPYYVVTNSVEARFGDAEIFYLPTDEQGLATIRLTTDGLGRRAGFRATVNAVQLEEPGECKDGFGGIKCETTHCLAANEMAPGGNQISTDLTYSIGRVRSQAQSHHIRAMPWAPLNGQGGCVWNVGTPPDNLQENIVAIRLIFTSPLDLEPQPTSNVYDSVVLRESGDKGNEWKASWILPFPPESVTAPTVHAVFIEKCDSDEICSFPWQTGVCSKGGCLVREAFDLPLSKDSFEGASFHLYTDRNDNGVLYDGVDFEAYFVAACPVKEPKHCMVMGGRCSNGLCVCPGDIPCTCPCVGDPPITTKMNVGLAVGVVLALFFIFIGMFTVYRHRKIRKSRIQKHIIEEKEAELEAFRNSVVGMRTATDDYIPLAASGLEEKALPNQYRVESGIPTPTVQWCWQETEGFMHLHEVENIVGDPADCWIKYDPGTNAKIEDEFLKGKKRRIEPLPGYMLGFDTMIQTKQTTGFRRSVQRIVVCSDDTQQDSLRLVDLSKAKVGSRLPTELEREPQMVLVAGDVIQISIQRQDGWAFGTKVRRLGSIMEIFSTI